MKSGFIAIVGRPNVGKSTLINKLTEEKVSIITDKAGTTRENIRCMVNKNDKQYIFIDTPGIHKPKNLLGEYMYEQAISSLNEADLILFLIDGENKIGQDDMNVYEAIKDSGTDILIVLNKIDLLNDEMLKEKIEEIKKKFGNNHDIVTLSSKFNIGVYKILDYATKYLKYDYFFYPQDYFTDLPVNKIVVEIIREKLMELTRDEIPHSLAIAITDVKTTEKKREYYINIYVERNSQKGIIIGKNGEIIKKVKELSSKEIEKLVGLRIKLNLWCKVEKNWRKNKQFLDELGYKNEK